MKKGIIKGFTERAKRLCDDEYLEEELKNIEDIFVANGYRRDIVKEYMKDERENNCGDTEEEEEIRGMVTIPSIPEECIRKVQKNCEETQIQNSFPTRTQDKRNKKQSTDAVGKEEERSNL